MFPFIQHDTAPDRKLNGRHCRVPQFHLPSSELIAFVSEPLTMPSTLVATLSAFSVEWHCEERGRQHDPFTSYPWLSLNSVLSSTRAKPEKPPAQNEIRLTPAHHWVILTQMYSHSNSYCGTWSEKGPIAP